MLPVNGWMCFFSIFRKLCNVEQICFDTTLFIQFLHGCFHQSHHSRRWFRSPVLCIRNWLCFIVAILTLCLPPLFSPDIISNNSSLLYILDMFYLSQGCRKQHILCIHSDPYLWNYTKYVINIWVCL